MSCQAKQSVIIPVLLVFLIFVIVICITLPLVFSINGTQDESKQRTGLIYEHLLKAINWKILSQIRSHLIMPWKI